MGTVIHLHPGPMRETAEITEYRCIDPATTQYAKLMERNYMKIEFKAVPGDYDKESGALRIYSAILHFHEGDGPMYRDVISNRIGNLVP